MIVFRKDNKNDTIQNTTQNATQKTTQKNLSDLLNKNQLQILELIKQKPSITQKKNGREIKDDARWSKI